MRKLTVFLVNNLFGPLWFRIIFQNNRVLIKAYGTPKPDYSPAVENREGYRFTVETNFPPITSAKQAASFLDVEIINTVSAVGIKYLLHPDGNLVMIELSPDLKSLN